MTKRQSPKRNGINPPDRRLDQYRSANINNLQSLKVSLTQKFLDRMETVPVVAKAVIATGLIAVPAIAYGNATSDIVRYKEPVALLQEQKQTAGSQFLQKLLDESSTKMTPQERVADFNNQLEGLLQDGFRDDLIALSDGSKRFTTDELQQIVNNIDDLLFVQTVVDAAPSLANHRLNPKKFPVEPDEAAQVLSYIENLTREGGPIDEYVFGPHNGDTINVFGNVANEISGMLEAQRGLQNPDQGALGR